MHVIIRQKKVVKIRTITVAPRDQSVGPLQLQEPRAGGTRTGAKLSRIQLNVVQTMIAVIVCFIVCWTPGSLANIVQVITVGSLLHIYEKNKAIFALMYHSSYIISNRAFE